MPDLISTANDLKEMSDQYLAQQMQNPSGAVPPWLVASEVQRRQELRSGGAQAKAPTSSVSQDLIKSLYAKIPPTQGLMGPASQPPGMTPPSLNPSNPGTLGSGPGTPPGSFKTPAKMMAEGGEFDESEDDGSAEPDPLDAIIQTASTRYNVPPEVIRAQISTESSGNKKARSPKDARGLMQIIPSTGAMYGVNDPTQLDDPATNVDVGTHYISDLLKKYNNHLPTALAAYNAGPGAVDKYGGIPPYRETQGYVAKNLKMINNLRKATGLGPLNQVPTAFQSRVLGNQDQAAPAPAVDAGAPTSTVAPADSARFLNEVNTVRQGVGMGPSTGLPTDFQSRLLNTKNNSPAAPAASAPVASTDTAGAADAAPLPEAAGDIYNLPTGSSEAREQLDDFTAPGMAEPAKRTPLEQTWQPPQQSQGMQDIQKQMTAMQTGHQSVEARQAALFQKSNLDMLNAAGREFFGAPQDYSKYQNAIDQVMQIAQKGMHPSIGDGLLQFGLALMANKSHYFGQAVGEAGSYALAGMDKLKQQSMSDFLTAAKAGVELQTKAGEYNAKLGQYKMQRLGAQQTGIMQDERAWQTQLNSLQRQYNTAANDYQKKIDVPQVQQMEAVAELNRVGIPLDPALNNPVVQAMKYPGVVDIDKILNAGKAGKASGPTTTEKTQEARAIGQLASHLDANGQPETWNPSANPDDTQYKSAFDKLTKLHPSEAGMPTVSASVMLPMEKERAHTIAQAIYNGDQDPTLTGMYRLSPLVREDLEKNFHMNLSQARLEYGAVQKFLASTNNAAAVQYLRSLSFANGQIPIVQEAYDAWKREVTSVAPDFLTRFRGFNSKALAASMQMGGSAGAAAQKLVSSVTELQSILPGIYSGGYAPHTEDLKKAEKMLGSEWDDQAFTGGLDLIKSLTKARQNAMKMTVPQFVRDNSPYLKGIPGSSAGAAAANQQVPGQPPAQQQAPPLPAMLSPLDVGKTFLNPKTGKNVKILEVHKDDWHKYRYQEVP